MSSEMRLSTLWLRSGVGIGLLCCLLIGASIAIGTTQPRYGREVTFVAREQEAGDFQLRRYDLLTGASAPLAPLDFLPQGISWSPDGERLALMRGTGEPLMQILEPDGTLTDVDLDVDDFSASSPSWSPDGEHIAFTTMGASRGIPRPAIHVLDLQDGSVQVMTDGDANDWYPSYSPSGEQIAFVSDRSQLPSVFMMNQDGSDVREMLRSEQGSVSRLSWSPGGDHLVFVKRFGSVQLNLFRINVTTRRVQQLTQGGYIDASTGAPIWSPDGKHILFTSNRSNATELQLYKIDADGTDLKRLTRSYWALAFPVWRP